jgi:hypothetical protein
VSLPENPEIIFLSDEDVERGVTELVDRFPMLLGLEVRLVEDEECQCCFQYNTVLPEYGPEVAAAWGELQDWRFFQGA